ncbi:MAG: permease [Chloroflexi bacterium]|nr:permease [Chloroflexota bacterium]
MNVFTYMGQLLQGGLGNLAAYLAAHVLLCLLPAFFIAGALTALVPKEAVTKYLGRNAPKIISYPAAALGGFVLAVCSCTILPLFAGIYKKGAGLGPAITFLFVGPAINILALSYTGVAIGMDIAIARLILSAVFGIGIGLIMALIFRKADKKREEADNAAFSGTANVQGRIWLFMLLLLAVLIAGTLQVGLLTNSYAQFTLPFKGMDQFQETLYRLVPFDPSRGEEGVTAQGAILIGLLILIGASAWFGLNRVDEGYNRWTWVSLALIALTLLVAAVKIVPHAYGLDILITGKMIAVAAGMIALAIIGAKAFDDYEMQEWLWETWRFVKQIFPLLIVGVFVVGAIRPLIKPEWIEAIAGSNTFLGNVVGVLFGVFMYFPTLVEVPIANLFLSLGMHRGPLLAYLMADPELSLQSILITASIIGKLKAWVYVFWVALFSTLAGLIYGAWVDGASGWLILAYLAAFLAILASGLYLAGRRGRRHPAAVAETAPSSR